MSGQMADIVVIDDEEYALVEPGPGSLFEPRDYGLSPVMSHSANMRGELARYRITDEGQLLLSDLQVGHVEAPPAINGIEPSTDEYVSISKRAKSRAAKIDRTKLPNIATMTMTTTPSNGCSAPSRSASWLPLTTTARPASRNNP